MEPPPAAAPDESLAEESKEEAEFNYEDFSTWFALATKEPEDAPWHIGDLQPEDNDFGSGYIPRILGPDDEPLPDMPWDTTGPNEDAKQRIATLLDVLRKSKVMAFFFERMPKDKALGGFYDKVYDLKTVNAWQIFHDLRHLVEGDVIDMAAHDWTLLVRTKPWCNYYQNPLNRAKYWELKREEDLKYEGTVGKMSLKNRMKRLEMLVLKFKTLEHTLEQQRQAIQLLLLFQKKYKFNSQMHDLLRENIAWHERDIVALKKDTAALKTMYAHLVKP